MCPGFALIRTTIYISGHAVQLRGGQRLSALCLCTAIRTTSPIEKAQRTHLLEPKLEEDQIGGTRYHFLDLIIVQAHRLA